MIQYIIMTTSKFVHHQSVSSIRQTRVQLRGSFGVQKRINKEVLMTQNKTARDGIALGNAAFWPERPEPVTLALTDPIVGVGTPPRTIWLCASAASVAKPTEAGFARKTE